MNPKARQSDSLPVPGPDARAQSEALRALIRDGNRVSAGGWLPFDRYMELALYAPGLGYYSGGAMKFGRRSEDGSDFVTAPGVVAAVRRDARAARRAGASPTAARAS